MKTIRKQLFTWLCVLSCISSQAQIEWTIYDEDNSNLLSNNCDEIEIAPDGRIWVSTTFSGAAVFDGTDWTRYTETSSDLVEDFIHDMVIDDAGNVWFATLKGVSKFDGTNFTTYDTANSDLPGASVEAMEIDINGDIWMFSKNGSFDYQGITIFNGSTWTTLTDLPSQIEDNELVDFGFTADNTAWIASNGITYYNGTFHFYPYASTDLWSSDAIYVDPSDNVWISGFAGLLMYDGDWNYISHSDLGFPDNVLHYDIFYDAGFLWIATSNGLWKYQISTGTIVENYDSSNSPLGDNCVSDITKDSDGNLWFATNIGVVKMAADDEIPEAINPSEIDAIQIAPTISHGVISLQNISSDMLNAEIEISDIGGKIIYTDKINTGSYTLDLSSFAKGMYFLSMHKNEALRTEKILLY